jgi:hypothetical protein
MPPALPLIFIVAMAAHCGGNHPLRAGWQMTFHRPAQNATRPCTPALVITPSPSQDRFAQLDSSPRVIQSP